MLTVEWNLLNKESRETNNKEKNRRKSHGVSIVFCLFSICNLDYSYTKFENKSMWFTGVRSLCEVRCYPQDLISFSSKYLLIFKHSGRIIVTWKNRRVHVERWIEANEFLFSFWKFNISMYIDSHIISSDDAVHGSSKYVWNNC